MATLVGFFFLGFLFFFEAVSALHRVIHFIAWVFVSLNFYAR